MNRKQVRRGLGALALCALSVAASAQSVVAFKNACTSVGNSPQEALAGREGQAISFGTFVCSTEGGPLDGITLTGANLWHWSGGSATLVTGSSVGRKPGAHTVFESTGGKMKLLMNANQVVGFEGEGKGVYRVATGSVAPLEGKTVNFKFKSIAPGRFEVVGTID